MEKYPKKLIQRVRRLSRLLISDSSGCSATAYLWSLCLSSPEELYVWNLSEELAYPTSPYELSRRSKRFSTSAIRFRQYLQRTGQDICREKKVSCKVCGQVFWTSGRAHGKLYCDSMSCREQRAVDARAKLNARDYFRERYLANREVFIKRAREREILRGPEYARKKDAAYRLRHSERYNQTRRDRYYENREKILLKRRIRKAKFKALQELGVAPEVRSYSEEIAAVRVGEELGLV